MVSILHRTVKQAQDNEPIEKGLNLLELTHSRKSHSAVCRGDTMREDHNQGHTEREERPKSIQSNTEPSLVDDRKVISPILDVHAPDVVPQESL